ncbi:MAG TPA: hypothetical protein VHQ47_17625 [Phycisphaerae bacterium]|nr:hypothetical protein [Phycisphaerae bacterium]
MAEAKAKFSPETGTRMAKATLWAEQQKRFTETSGYGKLRQPFIFPVLVKQNGGTDGTYDAASNTGTTASWAYDLYDLSDSSSSTKLNLSGAIQPLRSAARVTIGPVVQAADNTEGLAFYGADGAIRLWDCQETVLTEACS